MSDNTVLPNPQPLDEEKFHAVMMEAINRAVAKFGKAKVAQTMCLSIRQMDNLGAGSFPRPDRLANLRSLGADLLDPIYRAYGERSVPRDAVCSTDPVSSKLAALLARTIDMERPDSDGGQSGTLREVLDLDEATLRDCALKLVGWVEMIDAYRSGEKPKLRVAS